MLDKLHEMTGGNEGRIQIYLETFLEEMSEHCVKLEKAIEQKDIEQIRYVAHICKPLLSIMGFSSEFDKADKIEAVIRSEDTSLNVLEMASDLSKDIRTCVQKVNGLL